MLLESALADFSAEDSGVSAAAAQPEAVPLELGGTSDLIGGSNSEGAGADSTHSQERELDLKSCPGSKLSGELSGTSSRQSSGRMDSGSLKKSHTRHMSSPVDRSMDRSRHPPSLDLTLVSFTTNEPKHRSRHRSLMSVADGNLLHDKFSTIGEHVTVPSERAEHRGRSKGALPASFHCAPPQAGNGTSRHRALNSGADENLRLDNLSFTSEAGSLPFWWEARPGTPKLPNDKGVDQLRLQLPPSRAMVAKEGDAFAAPHLRSVRSFSRTKSMLSTSRENKRQPSIPTPQPKGPSLRLSKLRPVDKLQMQKSATFNNAGSRARNQSRSDDSYGSMDYEFKYYDEESPVSTLEPLPSPPANSSGSSGFSGRSPRNRSVFFRDPPLAALDVPPLPGFASTSAPSSPRASTSSSARYMDHCLAALQEALAADPEKSKRFKDSFVELDTFVHGDPAISKSPIDQLKHTGPGSPAWKAAQSEVEPEYNTTNFDHDDQGDERELKFAPSKASSFTRSYSGSSTTSIIAKPIKQSLNAPRVSVDEYSEKDKRFLSDHPSSWVEHGDDSICSTVNNSQCSTLTRHQEVSWDDQQADLASERAEEVVRGAVDGLRFTYSPVSSAFVFTRPNDEEGEGQADPQPRRHSRHNTIDSFDHSQRFSICLDYAQSIISDDYRSIARASDVTELGVSRAESWSRVARSLAFEHAQQSYQEHHVPLGLLRRARPLYAESISTTSDFNANAFVDCKDSMTLHKRSTKKTGLATCLPIRSIIRTFRTIRSPGRSRFGHSSYEHDRRLHAARRNPYA